MKAIRSLGAANLLAFTVTVLMLPVVVSGCVTPKVTAAPAPQVEETCEQEEAHLYCGCIASCGGGPPTLLGMPEEACQNPPPGCKALPIYCDKAIVEEVEKGAGEPKQMPLQGPSSYESPAEGPRVYEI